MNPKHLIPAIACAWERLEGRKAIITMKPPPKPIDVTPKLKRSRKAQDYADSPVDPTAPPPAK